MVLDEFKKDVIELIDEVVRVYDLHLITTIEYKYFIDLTKLLLNQKSLTNNIVVSYMMVKNHIREIKAKHQKVFD